MCRVIELFDRLPRKLPVVRLLPCRVRRRDLRNNRSRVRVSWFVLTRTGVGMTWTSLVRDCTTPVLRYDHRFRMDLEVFPSRCRLQANTREGRRMCSCDERDIECGTPREVALLL